MYKFILYIFIVPLIIYGIDAINLTLIFKRGKPYQAKIIYMAIVFSLSYLVVNFIYDFINALN